jgi:hypothetical protein
MNLNITPSAPCQILVHPNSGVPKVWIAVGSSTSNPVCRVWGSLKRSGLQAREASWSDLLNNVVPSKRNSGYITIPGQHSWLAVEQLVSAFLKAKSFISYEGYRLGETVDRHLSDSALTMALRSTPVGLRSPSTSHTGGNPFRVVSPEVEKAIPVLEKQELLVGDFSPENRPYAW